MNYCSYCSLKTRESLMQECIHIAMHVPPVCSRQYSDDAYAQSESPFRYFVIAIKYYNFMQIFRDISFTILKYKYYFNATSNYTRIFYFSVWLNRVCIKSLIHFSLLLFYNINYQILQINFYIKLSHQFTRNLSYTV